MSDTDQKINVDFREVGQTGLKRYGGFVQEEYLPELSGWRGVRTYTEMGSNDPVITAVLFAIEHLTRQVKWRVKPASTQPQDQEVADFIDSCMKDMSAPFVDVISEAMSMCQYGHAPLEIVYKRRGGGSLDPTYRSKFSDGRVGWRKLPLRSQDTIFRWLFDDNGGIQGFEQSAPPDYQTRTIPIEKLLLFRTTSIKNNPEGKSILRGAYRPWYFKKNIENIEGIGIERDLAGLPMASVPPELLSAGASPGQRAQLEYIKKLVTSIRRDEQEGVVFPLSRDANGNKLYELTLLNSGGARQFDTDKVVQRYDQRIAMCAMADFILLGHDKVGSFALNQSKTNLFSAALGSFMDSIAETFNRYAFPRLLALNDFRVTDYPTLEHGDLANVDLKEIGDYIQKLSGSGFPLFPNAALEKYLLEAAKIPTPDETEVYSADMQVGDTAHKGGDGNVVRA